MNEEKNKSGKEPQSKSLIKSRIRDEDDTQLEFAILDNDVEDQHCIKCSYGICDECKLITRFAENIGGYTDG